MTKRPTRQQKIISNYYLNRDDIMVQKLGEIVTELYLAESQRRTDQLWQRAEKALRNMSTPEKEIARLLAAHTPQALAKFLNGTF